jgi:hypothetical protein
VSVEADKARRRNIAMRRGFRIRALLVRRVMPTITSRKAKDSGSEADSLVVNSRTPFRSGIAAEAARSSRVGATHLARD